MTLLALSLAWLAGVGFAAAGYPEALVAVLPLTLGATAGFAHSRRVDAALLVAAAAIMFVAGVARLEFARPPEGPSGIALLNDTSRVRLQGVVAVEPEERGATQRLVLAVEEAEAAGAWSPSKGRVLVTARAFPRFAYGDRLELYGRLETPPSFEGFDYREYLARRGIVSLAAFPEVRRLAAGEGSAARAAVIDVRDALGDSLSDALPEPEAALGRGILLGQRTAIPAEITADFNAAGISHLIAISGSNVALVAGLALAALSPVLGRRKGVLAAVVLVGAFVILVGASPSVLRAGVMGAALLGARFVGRPASALTALAFAAALLTAYQPLAVLDVAFQLSFAATAGLILLAPVFKPAFAVAARPVLPAALAGAVAELMALTTAASVAVFPITAANFERVSLVALPANMLAVPLFGLIVITSAITAVAGLVWDGGADVAGRFAEVPLWALIQVAGFFAGIPGASLSVSGLAGPAAVALYAGMALATIYLRRRRTTLAPPIERLRIPWAAPAAALAVVVACAVWADVLSSGPDTLRVTILDVGQGDAILVESPSGHRILIDGGPSGPALLNALADALPAGARRLDLVVVTHPHDDHVTGLVAAAERHEVVSAATGGSFSTGGAYRAWQAAVAAEPAPIRRLTAGEAARIGGLLIEVLWPPPQHLSGTGDDLNNASVVLRLTYGEVSFLLAGDIELEGEQALLASAGGVRATVLKVAHHGSDGSSTDAFISAVRPSIAVISSGEGNTYGHPSPTALLRLAGTPLFRTDRNGSVRFETDGRRLFVKAERGSYQLVPVSAR